MLDCERTTLTTFLSDPTPGNMNLFPLQFTPSRQCDPDGVRHLNRDPTDTFISVADFCPETTRNLDLSGHDPGVGCDPSLNRSARQAPLLNPTNAEVLNLMGSPDRRNPAGQNTSDRSIGRLPSLQAAAAGTAGVQRHLGESAG